MAALKNLTIIATLLPAAAEKVQPEWAGTSIALRALFLSGFDA